MSSYTQNFTTRFRNKGVGALYWKAEIALEGSWPDGSGVALEFDTGESYTGTVMGPLDYNEEQTLILRCTAVDGMKKFSSPYVARLTVYGYRDANKLESAADVIQSGKLYIYSGGILAFDLGGDLSISTHASVETPVSDTILLGNVGDISTDWELLVTLQSVLEGKVTVAPDNGSLEPLNNVTLTMTLANPSLLEAGVYTGLVVASDPNGWSDSVSVPVRIEVLTGFPAITVTGSLAWSFLESKIPEVKQITIENSGAPGSTLNWTYEATGDLAGLMELSPASGTLAQGASENVDVTFLDGAETPVGSYTGTLRITAVGESEDDVPPVEVPITIEVTLPAYLIVTARTGRATTKAWFNVGTKWYYNGEQSGKPMWKPTSYSSYIRWAYTAECQLKWRYYIEYSGLFFVPLGIRGDPSTWLSGAGFYETISVTNCVLQGETITFEAGE